MSIIDKPNNPAELAELRAYESTDNRFAISRADEHTLAELDHAAEVLGFIGQKYFVEANRALVIPASFSSDDVVTYQSFYGLSFEGTFSTFGKVHIGRIIGSQAVRAICLAFPSAMLMPYFDPLDNNDILYVPALAVSSIEQTG